MAGPPMLVMFVLVLVLMLAVLALPRDPTLSDANKKLYSDLASGRGLYDNDSGVVVLNVSNFRSAVYGSGSGAAWLVEFYNSWCGFCQRFAATWKALATDVRAWKDTIRIAALDCALDDNNPFCREYEIMHYPALKFFSAFSNPGNMGIELEKGKNEDEIRHAIVQMLKKEQVEGRGSHWPNITPYRSNDVQNLWKNAPDHVVFTILIFEDSDSDIGTEAILDLNGIKSIQVRSVSHQNEALSKLMGVFRYPAIVVLEKDQKITPLRVHENSRAAFREAVKLYLQSKNIAMPKSDELPKQQGKVEVGDQEHISMELPDDTIYQIDLENTVKYSLKNEISLRKWITGGALVSLKKYLTVLARYFPCGPKIALFLEKLRLKILDSNELRGEHFLEYVESLEMEMKPIVLGADDWVGCKGSQDHFRGYPCGLWTMFHALTVNSVANNNLGKQFNSLEVLDAMLGYVTHFFGCHDCSQHFQDMAGKSLQANVTGPQDSILWLWSAHNQVNKRLSGDVTEDPHHPKIQFPSGNHCPSCRDAEGKWVTKEVLAYLSRIYGKNSIMSKMSDQSLSDTSKQSAYNPAVVTANIIFADNEDTVQTKRLGWNFNVFDISLCVVLYICSAIILILVFVKFIMRKRYRKKTYIHDLLGKV